MVQTFSELKKAREETSKKLIAQVNKIASGQNFGTDDETYWQPTVDKEGNGYAVIRYLPAPGDEELPFIRYWDHGFQGPGGWFIEKSLTTLGQQCPVSEYNSMLWNRNQPGDREVVSGIPGKNGKSGTKRSTRYVTNILVVEDQGQPANNGKVKRYRFGPTLFDMINEASNPKFPDKKAIDPFNMWEGANFVMRIQNVKGYRNYDRSTFDNPSQMAPTDEAMEEIWKKAFPLASLIAQDQFKSYADLKAKLYRTLGLVDHGVQVSASGSQGFHTAPQVASSPVSQATPPKDDSPPFDVDDDKDELAAFRKLAQ